MKCPVCTTVNLVMSERQGVEIDYCPECRGVWLDRGELDKIIERASEQQEPVSASRQQAPYAPQPTSNYHSQGQPYPSGQHHGYGHGHKPYKKKSLLSEIFDFD